LRLIEISDLRLIEISDLRLLEISDLRFQIVGAYASWWLRAVEVRVAGDLLPVFENPKLDGRIAKAMSESISIAPVNESCTNSLRCAAPAPGRVKGGK